MAAIESADRTVYLSSKVQLVMAPVIEHIVGS